MSGPEYECRKCGNIVSIKDYDESEFCIKCGTHLRPKYPPKPQPHPGEGSGGRRPPDIEQIPIDKNINVETLFTEFNRLPPFVCGEGIVMQNVNLWITYRRRAYGEFRDKLNTAKLINKEKLCEDYRQFLYFRNNISWTTLYRTGLKALEEPERLWDLVTFIQDESIDIKKRISNGLQGNLHLEGIGKNILTALLHVFHPDKYGVWNNRTQDTLEIIRRTPSKGYDIGTKYEAINKRLLQLCHELDTDLTTVDGLMWYISKRTKPKLNYPYWENDY